MTAFTILNFSSAYVY